MKNSTHQVVILDNLTSPYICQAIIVLKDYNPALQSKVVKDAEHIVNDYLSKVKKDENEVTLYSRPMVKRSRRHFKALTGLLAAAGTIVLLTCLFRFLG